MIYKISEIATVIAGATPSTEIKENYDGDIYWITPKDLSNNKGKKYIRDCERKITKQGFQSCSTTMIPANNILISTRAPIGYIAINSMDCCTNQGFKSLVCNSKFVDVDYLYYYLNYKMREIEALGSGTTFKEVSKNSIENFEIDVPNLEVQIKISKTLAKLDNQIERNTAMVKKLQVLGKAIFTRFFKEEKEITTLLKFPYISIIKPGIDKFNGEKRYLATAEVDSNIINYDAPFIKYENRESRANMQPISNSVWFAKMKNSIKHIFISSVSKLLVTNYVFSTGFFGIKCEKIAYEYMVNYLKLPYFEVIKDKLAHGATQEAVNNEDLSSIKIQLPSKSKLEEFHNKTKTIYENISRIEGETYKLSKFKITLLPLLMNGQLS